MKKSINAKLFICFSLLIIFVILFIWLINSLILERFYLFRKEQSLVSCYDTINETYNENPSPTIIETILEKLCTNMNLDLVLRDKMNITVYTSSKDFLRNKIQIPILDQRMDFDPENISSRFENGKNYIIESSYDNHINSEFMNISGILDNGYYIFIRTPLQSIKESVYISNSFLILVGMLSIFISSIAVLFISKTLTKPIVELNTIAKDMADLNFTKKYHVTTFDEVGMLGESINNLSSKLEKTILELKETNVELEKDIENKSRIDEMRTKFLSDVSHELKTPIALIQGYAEGLSENIVTDEESKKYYCDVILDEANKMDALVKDLLDLSRLEYGKDQLNIETFNITELISTVLKKNIVRFEEREIKVEFNQTEEIWVKGDTFRIEQVVTNYITNAINHADGEKIIKVTITKNETTARISVYNSGSSIDLEDIPRIWNRFYKVDTSRNRSIGGTGLGLSVVKAIMLQHGNQFGVQNIENGVEFWFELSI